MKEPHLEVESGSHEQAADARPRAREHIVLDCLSHALVASGEPRTSLGTPVNDVCAGLALRDTVRALFVGELLGCQVGWPRLVSAGGGDMVLARPRARVDEWLRDGDVLVELTRSMPSEAFELGIALPAAAAVHLSDRLLGAPSSSGVASRLGVPSDAECGVLAYAAARLAASHAGGWFVRDVRPMFTRAPHGPLRPALELADELVLWPVVIDTTVGQVEATLFLSARLANTLPAIELHTLLHESTADADTQALAVGEVWVSDQLPLTRTSRGLTGPVTLRVPGCEHLLAARLSEHYVRFAPELPRPTPSLTQLELLISARTIGFSALAALVSGARCFVGEVGCEPVSVRRNGQTIARGELIVWRGALGVRIVEA